MLVGRLADKRRSPLKEGHNPKTGVAMAYDYLIIGAGISGVAAAFELALLGSVVLIEAETAPGYHSTGRSAALYTPNYGGATVRHLNQASSAFFTDPPDGFCDGPLLTPRGSLIVAAPNEEDELVPILNLSSSSDDIVMITAARALEFAPLLRPERVAAATYEKGVMDMDVAALHQGFLRGLKQRGGVLICGKPVERLDRLDRDWRAVVGDLIVDGRVVVNAAGAWAGQIGEIAGAAPIGLVPKRRTGIIVDAPSSINVNTMPAIDYVGSDAYVNGQVGSILAFDWK
jgi:D-arginine dehydrogenase